MSKIEHDKYYTPSNVVEYVVKRTKGLLPNITEVIEPSAGGGAFIKALEGSLTHL